MTPENIAGFKVPAAAVKELIEALADQHEDNVIPIRPNLPKAA